MRYLFQAIPCCAVSAFLLAGAGALTGCAGNVSFPDVGGAGAVSTPTLTPLGSIQGNNYGGHAPIVGAHVFVLQPTQSGYGAKVTSLLNANYNQGSYPTALDNITGSPTNGMYYVTTDTYGNFNVSGDYACTAGLPVYVYASGGNPQTIPAVSVTGASAAPDANGNLLITYTNSGTNLLYQGEQITLGAFNPSTTAFNGEAGGTYTVSSLNLTTSTFAVEKGPSTSSLPYASFTTTATQAVATINPAIVNMAMLGVCPSASAFTVTAVPNGTSTSTYSGLSSTDIAKLAVGDNVNGPGVQTGGATITNINAAAGTITLNATDTGGNGVSAFTYTVTPPGGNFSSLQFVYVNEVSTEAMAVAMAPFTSVNASQNDALHIGTSSTNLVGLQTAANNAAELYDIQGSQVGAGGDGDAHIANATTPGIIFYGTTTAGSAVIANVSSTANMQVGYKVAGPTIPSGETIAALGTNTITLSTGTGVTTGVNQTLSAGGGFGTVPQALLNTLGNLLANCVDSANTYNAAWFTSGSPSAQCSTLFTNATSDGTPTGTKPNDTATAAINIARYPGGTTANTGYVTNLFNSITGNVPFQPNLSSSAPHDFAVGITYLTPGGNTAISDTEVDGLGNIWTVGNGSNAVYELLPSGVWNTYNPPAGSTVSNAFQTGVAIDPTSSNIYVPAGAGMLKFTPGTFTGTLVTASNNANAANVAIDGAGVNLYVAAPNTASQTSSQLTEESIAGVAAGGNFPVNSACVYEVQYVVLDTGNNVWTNNEWTHNNYICRYTSAGVLSYSLLIPGSVFPLSYGGAVDANGNFWFSEKDNSVVYKIAAGTTGNYTGSASGCPAGAGCTVATGGTINTPFAAAVDGANNVWITNSGTSPASVTEFNGSTAVAITPTFLSGTGYGTNYLSLQVDQSGSLWGTSYTTNSVVQYIGVATPAAMPLSYARANNKLGARP
jgi:hypothetical protein